MKKKLILIVIPIIYDPVYILKLFFYLLYCLQKTIICQLELQNLWVWDMKDCNVISSDGLPIYIVRVWCDLKWSCIKIKGISSKILI